MKMTKISLGVAAVCGVLSAPAHALLASSYTNSGEFAGDTQNIRVSGATAQDQGLLASTLRNCTAGSLTRYSISNNFVYFCTIDTTKLTPRAGATKLALYKYSVGGSGNGVSPVNSATPLPFLDLTKLNTSCAGPSSTADIDGTEPLPTFQDIACSGASSSLTTSAVSYIGLSDVEPAFFGAASTYNNLSSVSLASVIFGVPVTKAVYEYLQGLQGLTVGSLTEANMPSLSQAQLTSIFTQEGITWETLTGTPFSGNDDVVYVARRADSSGTQKTFEALIARTTNGTAGAKSCQVSVEGFRSGAAAADNNAANNACDPSIGGNLTINGSGSGQVVACLNKFQSVGAGGVGVLTTETVVSSGGLWRFVKINGNAPVQRNVAGGSYTQYADASLNTRIGANLPTASAAGYSAYLTRLKSDMADPTIVNLLNTDQPFGRAGLMALDVLNATVPTPDFTAATPRNPWSRLVGGTTLNNCQPGKLAAF